MRKLKEVVFEKTLEAYEDHQLEKTMFTQSRFGTLWAVIEDSGLEDEFKAYKKSKEESWDDSWEEENPSDSIKETIAELIKIISNVTQVVYNKMACDIDTVEDDNILLIAVEDLKVLADEWKEVQSNGD